MKKLAILVTLALALSTAALGNPIFADRGAEASNPLYEGIANGGGDCDDADRCLKPGHVAMVVQTWTDPDSDGDGISDLTPESTELIGTNRGQIISEVKASEKKFQANKGNSKNGKFKAGAELSKSVKALNPGDLDGKYTRTY